MVSSMGSVVLISWASLGAASEAAVDSAVVLSAVLAVSLEAAALLAGRAAQIDAQADGSFAAEGACDDL